MLARLARKARNPITSVGATSKALGVTWRHWGKTSIGGALLGHPMIMIRAFPVCLAQACAHRD
jgi:hypothetical protein